MPENVEIALINPFAPNFSLDTCSAGLRTLIERTGLSPDFLREINTPYGEQLDGMDAFIEKLHSYRDARLAIYPDFDMDGITSGTILYAGLKQLGFQVELSVPDYESGHDFCRDDVDDIMRRFPDTTVILTCDSGVNSTDGIRYAQSLGLAVLITDHHDQEIDCPADAMIDPCCRNSSYPLPGICGAAVAFLMISAYARRFANAEQRKYLNLLQLFVGIGTVSDVMPLVHDNRALVRKSLSLTRELIARPTALNSLRGDASVNRAFLTAFEGYAQLLEELEVSLAQCNEGFYGFTLAPMFNAPRRVGSSMSDAFCVFMSDDRAERRAAIVRLIAANTKRKKLVDEYIDTLVDTYAPYVYITDAPHGMLGLLAGKLMHASGLPTAVVHVAYDRTHGKQVEGSMRSPDFYPIIDMLNDRDGLKVVGHQGAGGVTGSLDALVDALQGVRVPSDFEEEPALLIGDDGPDIDVAWWDTTALNEITQFLDCVAPFGKNFDYPIMEIIFPADTEISRIGKEQQHLKLQMPGCPPVLLWNTEDVPISARVRLNYNEFRGQKTLQMIGVN